MLKKIIIGKDCDREIFKLENEALYSHLHFFNSADVLLGNPMSNTAVAFIYNWKSDEPPRNIRDFFMKVSSIAAITGYWRTTNGGKYAFSNILANPNINKLLVCVFDAPDNGHILVDALRCFWKNGIDENMNIIGSKASNPRFQGLSREALLRVREQCDLVIVTRASFDKIHEVLMACIQEPQNKRRVLEIETIPHLEALYDCGARFEQPYYAGLAGISADDIENAPASGLSSSLGLAIKAATLDDAFNKIVKCVFEKGSALKDQRKITLREARSLNVTITEPLKKLPSHYSREYLDSYKDEFINGVKEGGEFAYTYHERIFKRWGNQVERVIRLLESNPNTRRALISLWDQSSDLDSETPPCLDFLWYCIRDKRLECHVVYRSHHLATVDRSGKIVPGEGAFIPNIYAISSLQKIMAERLSLEPGPLVLTDFSGHLYVCD